MAKLLCILYPKRFFNENAKVTRLLLQLGMDVNKRDKHLATPLHFASSMGTQRLHWLCLTMVQMSMHRMTMARPRYTEYHCAQSIKDMTTLILHS
jgi:hypothetical protein